MTKNLLLSFSLFFFSFLAFSSSKIEKIHENRSAEDAYYDLLKKDQRARKRFLSSFLFEGKKYFHFKAFLKYKKEFLLFDLLNFFEEIKNFEEVILAVPGFLEIDFQNPGPRFENIKLAFYFIKKKSLSEPYDCGGFCSALFRRDNKTKGLWDDLYGFSEIFYDRNSLLPGDFVCFNQDDELSQDHFRPVHFAVYLGKGLYLSKFGQWSVLVTDFATLFSFNGADSYDLFRPEEGKSSAISKTESFLL